jgi:DNA-directed RNA polymerase I, II, and III subunit RPABC1
MDFETVDVLFRSRQTLLQILKAKGYNTTPYENFGPFEIQMMAAANREKTLRMDLERDAEGQAITNCRVEYAIPRVKTRLKKYLEDLKEEKIDPTTTELIIITLEPIGDSVNTAAWNLWSTEKLRINFFDAHTLVSNPLEHVAVPKHELVPESLHTELLKKYNLKTKMNLPMIKFHEDIIGRIIGLVPGDIVKITRPSSSAGEYIVYRVCVP